MKTSTITLILSLLMLLTATGIGHASLEELSLEELTQGAGAIVVGTVEDAEVDSVGTSDGGTMIYTFVHLSIHEVLKGRLEDRHVVVRIAGGKIGDIEIRVEDQPEFEKGQRVLVFLRQVESPLSSRRLFEVYGLFQGVRKPSDENISRVRTILDSSTHTAESDYFPMKGGMHWRFKATGNIGGETTDRIEAATEEGYRFASYNGHARTFAKSGSEVFEVRVREDGSIERRLWYDFSAATGDKWTIEPFDHTQGDLMDGTIVTVAGKNEEIRTAAGVEYAGCIHFRFDSAAGIADAGLLEEWFAPGKGCVKRVVQSIAGPIPYELVSLPIFIRSDALSLEVTTDKAHYEEGETIGITLTVRNNGEREVALDFPTSLQADYVIDGSFFKRSVSSDIHRVEVGATDGIYRWSAHKGFYQVTTWVTIPAGERHAWNFVHTPEDARLSSGPHRILALLAGGGSSLQAETEITVGNLGKIEGAVVDKDVQPLSDVRIVAYRKWEAIGVNPLPTDPDEPNDELFPIPMLDPHFTATDENGQFAFENLPVGESYLIGAFKEGYDLVWTEVEITSEAVPVEIILSETALATLTGHVLDQNGDPVSEADIRGMAYPDFGWLDRFPDLPVAEDEVRTLSDDVQTVESLFGSMEPWRSDLRPWMPLSRSFTASTDADGNFVIEGVPVGWILSLHAARKGYEPAFAELQMTSDPTPVELTMTKLRLGRIRGIVMDQADGSPIPEAHIVAIPKWDETEPAFDGQSVSGELISAEGAFVSRTSEGGSVEVDPDIISYPTRFGPYQAVTDENGEFTLDEVNLDLKFLLWAYKEGYDPAHADVEDPSDDAPYVEIALTKIEMGVLTGIVTDDSGEAVPGAEVLAYPEIYAPIPEIGISTRGEDDGEGAASDAGAAVQSPEIGIAIEPPRGPFQEYSTTTDADGRFVIERIPIGKTIAVSARKRGYEVAHRRIERTEKETFVRLYLIAFEDEYPNRNATVRDGGRYEVAMDRMAYNADETARLRYRVMNLAEEAKTFSFPTSRRVEFLVLSMESNRDADPYSPDDDWEWPGTVIWRWSEGQEFEGSPGEITLAQGESAAFEGTLDLGTLNSDERGFLLLGFLAGLRKETQSYAKFMIEREAPIDAQVTIAGVVTDAEGRPLARANVAARTADVTFKSLNADVERHTVVTDEKGCFALKGLYRGGTYEVTAFREGYTLQQKIIYAIQEQNDVRFALHREDSANPSANVSVFVQDGVQIELITDGHFYAGADDVIRMCYRITNAREAPISFHFSNGQQVDFVLKQEDRVLWRWSDGRGFIEAETTLELPPGASKAFKTEFALASLNAADGNLLLSGYLNLPEDTEKTRASLELTFGEAYEVVHVGTEASGLGPIQVDSRMGTLVELLAPSGIKGQIEFSEQTRNTLGDLAGHRFLRMVNFQPDPVLSAFVEQVYVEIEYDPAQLNALGIETEEAVQIFIWDASDDPPGWRKVEGGVDPERNVAWANVPNMGTQWALFAAEPLAVEEQTGSTPSAFSLAQNAPNPFNPATTIRFSIPDHLDAKVALVIYNTMGQRVRTLVEDTMEAGVHSVAWDGRDEHGHMVSSGVYLYHLTMDAGKRAETKKMVLIR